MRFHIYEFLEVLGLEGVEKIISKRDDFVVDLLFHLVPMQRFENRGDSVQFLGFQLLHE